LFALLTFLLKYYITFNHLADAFVQSCLQMRTIEAIKPTSVHMDYGGKK